MKNIIKSTLEHVENMREINRFDDALYIVQGACNPSGIALALHKACVEAMREGLGTKQVCEDAAVRLIAHQLAYLLKISEVDDSLTLYGELTDICKLKGKIHYSLD